MIEFGEKAFTFEVLEECSKEDLLSREYYWIRFYNSASLSGFNTREDPLATYDIVVGNATRQRRSATLKGKPKSELGRLNIKAAKQGTRPTFAAMSNGGKSHKGKKNSPETIAKMRIAAKARAEKRSLTHPPKPRVPKPKIMKTEEEKAAIRAKISATLKAKGIIPPSRKGVTATEESKAKVSATMSGRIMSDEHKANLAEAARNRSAEHRQRLSEAAKLQHEKARLARSQTGLVSQ